MRLLLCLFVLLSTPAVVHAQEPPAALTFEVIAETHYDGDGLDFKDLLFSPSSTLLALADNGLCVLPYPYEGSWEVRGVFADQALFRTADGLLFASSRALARSDDGGYTWEFAFPDSDAFVELPPDAPGGAAFLTDGDDRTASPVRETVARSTDGGLTWTPHAPGPSVLDRVFVRTLAYAPPSECRLVGTVAAVGVNGAAYSTDGGVTWAESSLSGGYLAEHAFYSERYDLLVTGATGPAPDGGVPWGGVWVSEDGVTWTFRGRMPSDADSPMMLVEAPDGAWWAIRPGERDGGVFSSEDGGATWVERGRLDGAALTGQEFLRTNAVAIGPDGRVWLATSGQPGNEGAGTILRSVEQVVVASEPDAAPGAPDEAVALGVPYPNPTNGHMTVPLVLGEASEVRVAVYDVLGRTVAVLTEGVRAAGTHALGFDTADLASGVYLVRAHVGTRVQTQRVTVTG